MTNNKPKEPQAWEVRRNSLCDDIYRLLIKTGLSPSEALKLSYNAARADTKVAAQVLVDALEALSDDTLFMSPLSRSCVNEALAKYRKIMGDE